MNKRKQKQIRQIMAAKRAEKCGQIDLKNLQAQVWDLAVQSQQTASWVKTQGETIRLLNRFHLREIDRLEKRITSAHIGDTLLGLLGGMIGGLVGMFMWLLWVI